LIDKIRLLQDPISQASQMEEIAMNLARYIDWLLDQKGSQQVKLNLQNGGTL
jgi:hypothetical protein